MINANPLPQTVILPVGKTPPKLPSTIIPEGVPGDTIEISKKLAGEIFSSIMVWRFHEAPERFRQLSDNGGDEDWVAYVPDVVGGIPNWIDCGGSFAVCDLGRYPFDDGVVYIGSHA